MNLFSSSVVSSFSGAFGDLFDSFARSRTGRYIIVYKEPIKQIIQNDPNMWAGYSDLTTEASYQLIPVSGVFPAQIIYDRADNKDDYSKEINTTFAVNPLKIKVEKDAALFINNGKTQNVIVDDQTFDVVSEYKVQDYIGLQYFYFELLQTL